MSSFHFDKRHRKRTEKEKKTMRIGIDRIRSFMKSEVKERGIQPLCRKCVHKCKVLDGPDSTFICNDYRRENEGKKEKNRIGKRDRRNSGSEENLVEGKRANGGR